VKSRNGKIIASSVTNFDIHDIARLAATYDLASFNLITPLKGEQAFIKELLSFWNSDVGMQYNQYRRTALEKIRIFNYLEELISMYKENSRLTIGTSAKYNKDKNVTFSELRKIQKEKENIFLIFGTANGISDDYLKTFDYILEPISFEQSTYNHLSVRSAVSIIVDRLCARA
jgi:hypothetical protein